MDFSYPEGVVDDLSVMELKRATSMLAVRKGLAQQLSLMLRMTLDGLLTDRKWQGESTEVSLELAGSDDEVTVQLEGLHRGFSRSDWLEVSGEGGQRRIAHDQVKMLGITVTRPEVEDTTTEPSVSAEQPEVREPRRRWFNRSNT